MDIKPQTARRKNASNEAMQQGIDFSRAYDALVRGYIAVHTRTNLQSTSDETQDKAGEQ